MAKSVTVDRVKFIAEMARQKITGAELSQKAGVGSCSVQKMRAGKSVWRTTAQHVAGALGVPLEDLMDGGD
jgi:transcriptional regulator with XRE-family HTH domain